MQPSMANLNSPSSRVVKDSTPFRRRILRCKNFGKGESWPSLFLDEVNLYLMKFRHRWILNERTFCSFIILFIWKWILTWNKWISLVNLYLTLFSRWWILTQLFWKRGELMVNLDLTIFFEKVNRGEDLRWVGSRWPLTHALEPIQLMCRFRYFFLLYSWE